ncbi:MAG: lysine--tRNA ligase [Mycoplasmatales bacterium]
MENNIENNNEQIQNRIDKIKEYEAQGIKAYPNKIKAEHNVYKVLQQYEELEKEELTEQNNIVSLTGRVIAKRGQGKAGFLTIKDNMDKIQFYGAKDNLTEEEFFLWKKLDLGDIIYGQGEVFKTKVGALAIRIKALKLVTKSIRPLPEKFHGLTDVEIRYRQRYVDLIVNDESKDKFIKRSQIITGIRNYLNNLGYMEVETPILQTIAGGASAKPFLTHHNTLDIPMYLRIAPELHLKRLIVGGFAKVYEIGRLFRNEGISIKHNPEFTSVELYEAYGDMAKMMEITEHLIQTLAQDILNTQQISYENNEINLAKFEKIHMVDLIKRYTEVDFFTITNLEEALQIADTHNIELDDHQHTIGHIINEFFEQICEDKLIQPTMVYGHPVEVSPLARVNDEDKRFTDRFELFIGGREYANAFSELNDPFDQKQRFEAQVKEKELGNDEATDIDHDFIEALAYGMPPTGGLGIGIDRLVMLLTNAQSIRDVILFPTMKEQHK